jgi:hypothetical protein
VGNAGAPFSDQEQRVRTWIEHGKQVGKGFRIEREGRRLCVSIAIQQQHGEYRVNLCEFDDTQAFDDDPLEDTRSFATLSEAIAFVESATPVKVEELAPRKGQRWFR